MADRLTTDSPFVLRDDATVAPYEQLAGHVREMIASGELTSGDSVPSIRQMAAALKVPKGVVERAYALLQQQGFIVRAALGFYVQKNESMIASGRLDVVRSELSRARDRLREQGFTDEEIRTVSHTLFQSERSK